MNSSYSVSDVGSYSPLDMGQPSVMKVTTEQPSKKRKLSDRGDGGGQREDFKVFIMPTVRSGKATLSSRPLRLLLLLHRFTVAGWTR